MGEVIKAEFARCAGTACKNRVRLHTRERKVLCKGCWHKKIEKAALYGSSMMHVAFSDAPHEFVVIDHLKEFTDEYDIERPHN